MRRVSRINRQGHGTKVWLRAGFRSGAASADRPPVAHLLVVAFVLAFGVAAVGQSSRVRSLNYDKDRREWVEIAPPPPGTPAGDLHLIREAIKDRQYGQALSRVDAFKKRFAENDENYPALLIAEAEALLGLREFDKAHETLQKFLGQFSGIGLTSEALRLEFEIAETWLNGIKRKWLGMRILSGKDQAYRILDEISSDHQESPMAELALKTKGDRLFAAGDYGLSELEYVRLLQEHPQSRYRPYALRRSADGALASFGGVPYDEAALVEAEERFNDYRMQYPREADAEGVGLILDDIAEKRAEKDLAVGQYYERTNHLRSAVFYYESVVKEWPKTVAATKAADRLEMLGAAAPPANPAAP